LDSTWLVFVRDAGKVSVPGAGGPQVDLALLVAMGAAREV